MESVKSTITVYFPDKKLHWIEELRQLAEQQDRSLNYVVLTAIGEHLEREKLTQ